MLTLLLAASLTQADRAVPATPAEPPATAAPMPPVPVEPAPPAAEPPIATAAKAFSSCIGAKVRSVSTTLAVEAAADDLIRQCGTEKARLDMAFAAIIENVPAADKAAARKEYDQGMAQGRQGVIDAIRSIREAKSAGR